MHGEYKVPGGKLVVVDLEVVDGVIAVRKVSRPIPYEASACVSA